VLKFVGMIHCVLHHLQASTDLIHAGEVQNRRTDKSSEHNEDGDL